MANSALSSIWAVGLGAGLMLVLDPVRGRRRRALMRDKVVRAMHKSRDALGATGRDVSHRAVGLVAVTRARLAPDGADDELIVSRVRSAIGRAVSHPHALSVSSDHGDVRLTGPVLADEVAILRARVASVRGVRSVHDQLDVRTSAEEVPSLQGGRVQHHPRSAFSKENWPPTARVMAGSAGLGLMLWGARRVRHGSVVGAASLACGAGLCVRGLTNLETPRLLGLAGNRGLDVQKTMHIAKPVEEVFRRWRQYEQFPHFMRHVRKVRDLGDGRSRWTVEGPAGVPIHWEAEITREIPNQLIAWRTVSGSAMPHTGSVRFDPTPDGETRATLRLCYNPPAGAVAHGVAWLLGADPKQRVQDDLLRMKRFIETGHPAHDAAQPTHH